MSLCAKSMVAACVLTTAALCTPIARADTSTPSEGSLAPPEQSPAPASAPPYRAPIAALEVGGMLGQGLDTTDSASRQAGVYAGGAYMVTPHIPLALRYSGSAGSVRERIATAGGPAQDVVQNQVRHALDLTIGYRLDLSKRRERLWLLPFLGPRALFLVEDVSPQWGLEGEGGLRVGLTSKDLFEVNGFVAYGRAVAATDKPSSVYGALLAETRFGANVAVRAGGPFSLSVGYEGDVVVFEHENLTVHQLLAGVIVDFD
jgi:hypothetical protein